MRLRLLLVLACLLPALAHAGGDPSYLQQLQQQARETHLGQDAYWLRLLHFRDNRLLPGASSTIDDAVFFNSPQGKHDAEAELDATLARFFSDAPVMDEPAQCRFKARYEWLRQQLQFDPARLQPQSCPLHEAWMGNLDTTAIAAVFAANDLNSPATMYGHSLLRLDRDGQGADQRLLAYAVNYAANIAQGENMLTYTVLGISGGFAGQYSVYRYHEKVRQYARINNRDLWEYPLSLSREEVRRVLWHLWEMRGVGSEYFFFTENCSYMMLALLQTARPGLYLTRDYDFPGLYTIPVDTLRTLREAGLLDTADFRPSLARRLQHQLHELTPSQEDWVLAVGESAAEVNFDDPHYQQASPRDRARMLETANDRLYLRFNARDLDRATALPATRALLAARSQLDAQAEFSAVPVPETSPDRGHETSRWTAGWRHAQEQDAAVLRFRGAYHDRLDPPAGYLAGGELEFFDLGLLAQDHALHLSDLQLVNVQAISAWDRAFKPWSWQVSGGLRHYGLDALRTEPQRALGAYVDGGMGLAVAPFPAQLLYAFAFAQADANQDLDHNHALSAGLRGGWSASFASRWMQQLEIDYLGPVAGAAVHQLHLRLGLQWQLAANDGLRLNLQQLREPQQQSRSLELSWQHYF